MDKILTVISLIVMLISGYWMSSDKIISVGSIFLGSNWGSVGLALGACIMIISTKKR